jgi:hypothetical protein
MRVSAIFAQGGGGGRHGRGDDYGHGCGSGCGDYYSYGGDYYYNGYNRRGCRDYDYDYDYDGGLLSGLLG